MEFGEGYLVLGISKLNLRAPGGRWYIKERLIRFVRERVRVQGARFQPRVYAAGKITLGNVLDLGGGLIGQSSGTIISGFFDSDRAGTTVARRTDPVAVPGAAELARRSLVF